MPISRSRRRGEIVGLRLGRQFEAQLSVLAFFVPPAMSAHRSSPCSLWGYDGKVTPKDRETFNPSLEGLRGLAALAVCAHHGMSAFSDGSNPHHPWMAAIRIREDVQFPKRIAERISANEGMEDGSLDMHQMQWA